MLKKSTIEQIISQDMADLWSVLTPEERRLAIENVTLVHFDKNDIIYNEHDEARHLWCLLKGKIKKYKAGIGDRVQILRMHRPVQYFGYRAHFAGERHLSSAAAFESCTLAKIPMSFVETLIRKNSDVAMFFIHELARNLGGSDTKIVSLTQKHIRGRLAEALLLLKESYGLEDDGTTIKIYMSREDLASLSNMTTSNAIRTLRAFVAEKLILVDGRRIKIINESQLLKISRCG